MTLNHVKTAAAILAICCFTSITAKANVADGSVSTKSPTAKPFGVNVALGDPFPGLVGINGAYNVNDNIRLTAGYAEVEVTTSLSWNDSGLTKETVKATTVAAGGQYLFTDWSVKPTVGLHAGYFSVSGKGKFEINGFDKSTGYLYSNLGIDWISDTGYQLATGINMAFVGSNGTGMYANVGYFF